MDFSQRLKDVDLTELQAYLSRLNNPCYESDLLKAAFHLERIPDDALELYQIHFVLFHTLYMLQNDYASEGQYLHIHFMRTFLLPYPAEGFCRYYDSKGFFCKEVTEEDYCPFHRNQIGDDLIADISEKYFYLDAGNYEAIKKEQAESFIRGAWEIMTSWDRYEEARKILGLPAEFDIPILQRKFKKLARNFHPDTGSGLKVSKEDEFIRINNAYRFLRDMIS